MSKSKTAFRFNQDHTRKPKYEHRHAGPAFDDENRHKCTCGFINTRPAVIDHVARAANEVESYRRRMGYYSTPHEPTSLDASYSRVQD